MRSFGITLDAADQAALLTAVDMIARVQPCFDTQLITTPRRFASDAKRCMCLWKSARDDSDDRWGFRMHEVARHLRWIDRSRYRTPAWAACWWHGSAAEVQVGGEGAASK
jgi:hypothetical protein